MANLWYWCGRAGCHFYGNRIKNCGIVRWRNNSLKKRKNIESRHPDANGKVKDNDMQTSMNFSDRSQVRDHWDDHNISGSPVSFHLPTRSSRLMLSVQSTLIYFSLMVGSLIIESAVSRWAGDCSIFDGQLEPFITFVFFFFYLSPQLSKRDLIDSSSDVLLRISWLLSHARRHHRSLRFMLS